MLLSSGICGLPYFLQLLIETQPIVLGLGFDFQFPGGLTARVTPVPIPNTEVKPRWADDTALETTRERRSPPGLSFKQRGSEQSEPFCFWIRGRRNSVRKYFVIASFDLGDNSPN
jgi:hypothetical protein